MRALALVLLLGACRPTEPALDLSARDAATGDAAHSSSDDGDLPTVRTTCGTTTCRTDQICNAGTCEYPCDGDRVPGDYATIEDAITSSIGVADLTICLGPQSYPEAIVLDSNPSRPRALQIVGLSSSATTVRSLTLRGAAFSRVALRGITFEDGVTVQRSPEPVEIVGCALTTTHATAALMTTSETDVLVDGCELTGSSLRDGITVDADLRTKLSASMPKLVVQNSYLHDVDTGVFVSTYGTFAVDTPTANVRLVNDTFADDDTGIYTVGSGAIVDLTIANSLVTGSSSYGIDLEAMLSRVTMKSNVLDDNIADYAGNAIDVPGNRERNPLLDIQQSPPGLRSASPARGAADPTLAPWTDFWGVARGVTPDIGATQN